MNSKNSIRSCANAFLAMATLAVSSVGYATTDWSFSVGQFLDGTAPNTALASNVSAWSTTGSGATYQTACLHDYGTAGYGIVNRLESTNQTMNQCDTTTGPHAADNQNGVDGFLLQFSSAVALKQIQIGWNGTDNFSAGSDMSVLRYTGNSAPASFTGKTIAQLLNSGWQLVGHYGQVGALANNTATISNGGTSSWWLVSAYSSAFGSAGVSSSGSAIASTYDYFKLLSVAGTADSNNNHVPEPGSLVLAGIGLLGAIRVSRRRLDRT